MSNYIIRMCLLLYLAGMAYSAQAQDEFSELYAAYADTPEQKMRAATGTACWVGP